MYRQEHCSTNIDQFCVLHVVQLSWLQLLFDILSQISGTDELHNDGEAKQEQPGP